MLQCSSFKAGVAQLVERNLAKVEVESSRLFSRSISSWHSEEMEPAVSGESSHFTGICSDEYDAGVAQLVERNLAKVEVESSRLFSRSIFSLSFPVQVFQSGLAISRWQDSKVVMQRPAKP